MALTPLRIQNGVPTLMYRSVSRMWQNKHESKINAGKMCSLRSIYVIRVIEKMFIWLGHVKRMNKTQRKNRRTYRYICLCACMFCWCIYINVYEAEEVCRIIASFVYILPIHMGRRREFKYIRMYVHGILVTQSTNILISRSLYPSVSFVCRLSAALSTFALHQAATVTVPSTVQSRLPHDNERFRCQD